MLKNVGVNVTIPMKKIVAIDWKSYRSATDFNSPRAVPAWESNKVISTYLGNFMMKQNGRNDTRTVTYAAGMSPIEVAKKKTR